MTFEELKERIETGERIGETLSVHEAMLAMVLEMDRLRTLVTGEHEETEDEAWEHTGEIR